jgi:hypothetical protein
MQLMISISQQQKKAKTRDTIFNFKINKNHNRLKPL